MVVEVAGLGLKIGANRRTLDRLGTIGDETKIFTYFYVREIAMELYGFHSAEELHFFELLISVSGVGPKSALSILDIAELKNLAAAIKEDRPDLLIRASGIGRKTAERIILELKNKVQSETSDLVVGKMEADADLVETLTGLGYRKDDARIALSRVDGKIVDIKERLKAAFKILSARG